MTALAFVAVLAVACSDDGSSGPNLTTVTTARVTTTALTTTVPSTSTTSPPTSSTSSSTTTTTTAAGTTLPGTTLPGGATTVPPTTEPCERPDTNAPVVVNYPQQLSSLFGQEVSTGGHTCFERFVIDFEGIGDLPGYAVRYEPDPLTLSSSGEPVELRGAANLVVFAGSWMGEEGNYAGPRQIFPTNVSLIKEVTLLDNFESVMIWGIGLDRERNFRVFTLPDPFRIVVDIDNS